jgi:hypothetical protein
MGRGRGRSMKPMRLDEEDDFEDDDFEDEEWEDEGDE